MASMTMAGSLCRVRDFEPTGKWRHHQLIGTKLQQCKSGSTTHFAREVDIANTRVSFLHTPSAKGDVSARSRPSRMFKITFKASKLEFLCPSEQECELWVSKISEAAQWGRTSELTQSVASSHKSFEQMYMWDEDQSTMFSQEESSFARSMSPSTQRPHSVAPTPHFEQQPHLARKLQYSQEAATGSDSVGGLGVSVIMHQTGYPLVVELDPLGPAAQSKQIFPGDLIYAANGKHLNSMSLPEIVESMVGEPGTAVELLCDHANNVFEATNEVRSVLLTRQQKTLPPHPMPPNTQNAPYDPTSRNLSSPPPSQHRASRPFSPSGDFQSQSPPTRPSDTQPGKFAEIDGGALQQSLSSFYLEHSPLRVNRVPALIKEFVSRGGGQKELDALNLELRSAYGKDLSSYFPPLRPAPAFAASASSTLSSSFLPSAASSLPASREHGQPPKSALRLPNPQFQTPSSADVAASHPGGPGKKGSAEIVEFNVGGQVFMTSRATLEKAAGSLLAGLLAPHARFPQDEEARPFIDRDPSLFEPILDYLRHGVVREYDSVEELRRAVREARDYGLEDLAAHLSHALSSLASSAPTRPRSPPHDRALDPSPSPPRGRRMERENNVGNGLHSTAQRGLARQDAAPMQSQQPVQVRYPVQPASERGPRTASPPRQRPGEGHGPGPGPANLNGPGRQSPVPVAPGGGYRSQSPGGVLRSQSPALRRQPQPLAPTHPASAWPPPSNPAAPPHNLALSPRVRIQTPRGGESASPRRARRHSQVELQAEVERVRELLTDFYRRVSARELHKVDALTSDFESRGGGEEEYQALNLSLHAKFALDLGPYQQTIAPLLPPRPQAPPPQARRPPNSAQPPPRSASPGLTLTPRVRASAPHSQPSHAPATTTRVGVGPVMKQVVVARSRTGGVPPSPGILLDLRPGTIDVAVTGLTIGGPAHASGAVLLGDQLLQLDSIPVPGLPLDQVRALLHGPEGSLLSLLLLSPAALQTQTVPRAPSPSPALARSTSPLLHPTPRPSSTTPLAHNPSLYTPQRLAAVTPAHRPHYGESASSLRGGAGQEQEQEREREEPPGYEGVRVWVRAARNLPSELAHMQLFCTVELDPEAERGPGEGGGVKKKTGVVVYGGQAGEAVTWNSHCVLDHAAPHSSCLFRLWCRGASSEGAEPLHAGFAPLDLLHLHANHLFGRELWLPLQTLDGAPISRVPGEPLAIAVTVHPT